MSSSTGRLWPIAVIAVLTIMVLANLAILRLASDPDATGVEPNAYGLAVAWDSTAAERDASRALGWNAVARLEPTAAGARAVVSLSDPLGAPIAGARVEVVAIHNGLARRFTAELPAAAEAAPGTYAADLPLPRAGLWELRLHAARGDARFVTSLRVELAERAP